VTDVSSHVLAPPFGLPGELDGTLLEALRDERWSDAVTLLRDHLDDAADAADAAAGRRLLLLAYARYRDATEVMFEERLAASQEALQLIDRAVELGVDPQAVAPLREEVEHTLDEESRAELAVLAQLPESGDYAGLPLELLLDAGHRLWSSAPGRAAELFAAAAKLDEPGAGPLPPAPESAGEGASTSVAWARARNPSQSVQPEGSMEPRSPSTGSGRTESARAATTSGLRSSARTEPLLHQPPSRGAEAAAARRLANRVREGLCRSAAGQHAQARPLLEAALVADWSAPGLRDERHLAEDAVTALLRQASGDEFTALWNLGAALGRRHGLAFPSVWPNQEALLDRCVELRDWPRARVLAARIEESREVLPRRLAARLQQVRLEQA